MTNTTTTTPAPEQQTNELSTPWTLQFDRDGTEDFGIICDANGNDLVASHLPQRMPPRWASREFGEGCFWLPEEGDPIPVLVRQMQLMTAAPALLKAAIAGGRYSDALKRFQDDGRFGITVTSYELDELFADWHDKTHAAIAEAKGLAA